MATRLSAYKTGLDGGAGLTAAAAASSSYYTRSVPIRGASKIVLAYWVQNITQVGNTPTLLIAPGFSAPPGATFTGNTATTPRLDSFTSDAYNEAITDLSLGVTQTTNAHASATTLAVTTSPVVGVWTATTANLGVFPSAYCRIKATLANPAGPNAAAFTFGLFRIYVYYPDTQFIFNDHTSVAATDYVSG